MTTAAAIVNQALPQPRRELPPVSGGISGHREPPAASVVDGGPELSAAERVRALTGAERAVLLDQIAAAYPDVVEAGFELVARWRAECAEHRRKSARRLEHDRRARRRAEEGDGG